MEDDKLFQKQKKSIVIVQRSKAVLIFNIRKRFSPARISWFAYRCFLFGISCFSASKISTGTRWLQGRNKFCRYLVLEDATSKSFSSTIYVTTMFVGEALKETVVWPTLHRFFAWLNVDFDLNTILASSTDKFSYSLPESVASYQIYKIMRNALRCQATSASYIRMQ